MRASASRIATSTLPNFEADDGAADEEADDQREAGDREQRVARRRRLHVEAEDILEIGQAVVAAEAEIVAEEAEHQRDRSCAWVMIER